MKNSVLLFIILFITTFMGGFISKEILNTDELVISSLAERLTNRQIEEALDYKEKWEWAGYIFLPVLLLIKISIIAAIIDAGCFFFEKEIKYDKLFNIVTQAEFVFLLVIVFKTGWFYFFQQNYTLEDLQYFYPLSFLGIVGYDGLPSWFIYPLQVINLFELAYWFILAYLIGKELKVSTERGLSIVASSYGVGLLIWVVGVMFFTLSIS